MRSEKAIAVIGVADEDVARLCLLLRQILPRLEARWRWGVETRADLIVVDPSSFLGMMGWMRARAAGVRCAVIEPNAQQRDEYGLARPFSSEDLERILNTVSRESARPQGIEPYLYDFYYRELGSEAFARKPATADADVAPGFEEFLRANPEAQTGLQQISLPQANSLHQPVLAPRLDAPIDPVAWRLEPARQSRGSISLVHDRSRQETPHTLWAYLTGDLLGGPSRLNLGDAPALVLDPLNRVFYSDATLRSLQVHCDLTSRRSDWQSISNHELEQLRRDQPAQPYSKLLWLDALAHAGGQLAPHLDPGGLYRLTQWLDIDNSLPRLQRIATCMVQARRLHEIADASRTSMADVFDAVSAFEAVGVLQWSRRATRVSAPARKTEGINTLVSRLRVLIETHGRDRIGLGSNRHRRMHGSGAA